MNPTVALLIGVILIGVVASGRATAVWNAITGNSGSGGSNTLPGIGVPGGNAGPPHGGGGGAA